MYRASMFLNREKDNIHSTGSTNEGQQRENKEHKIL